MTGDVRLGFIPLNDCAPLVVAKAKGFFAEEGLSVTLSREASWATVRDKVAVGALDGAHMLAPMVLAASLGIGGERTPLIAPLSLNLNGSAFTVSRALAAAVREIDPEGSAGRSAQALARVIAARRARGEGVLTFAVVFPYSIHNYALRYWLADAGVDPDQDVRLVVAPPPRMADQLRAGMIDGFCVGAPWNALAVGEGAGDVLAMTASVWRHGPDKVLGVGARWADANPEVLQALMRALIAAGRWADTPGNRPELAALLADPACVGAPVSAVSWSLTDEPGGVVYHRHAAGFPWRSHAAWFASQMLRWGQALPSPELLAVGRTAYRPDLYRIAATAMGEAAPTTDSKIEGTHDSAWAVDGSAGPIPMGADSFCDGRLFDPDSIEAYAAGFAITHARR